MVIRRTLSRFAGMALLVAAIGCSAASPAEVAPYRDVLVSCSTVSEKLEFNQEFFGDTGGRIYCHGGEWITTSEASMGAGHSALVTRLMSTGVCKSMGTEQSGGVPFGAQTVPLKDHRPFECEEDWESVGATVVGSRTVAA